MLIGKQVLYSIKTSEENILESFIIKEGKLIEDKTRSLILAVKKWETGELSDFKLAKAITEFCQDTYAVRLPMASFFLRMLLPEKFGTLDFRCINALKSLGFAVKEIPPESLDKNAYLQKYNGLDYLEYNKLITEIGRHYKVYSKFGGQRHLTPSEVDMALYQYDKEAGVLEKPIVPSGKLSRAEKIQKS